MIEDASQAHLAALHGQKVGTWADAGAFSFYPTKNMTTGEGGMVSVRDESVARRVRLLRNQGQEVRYRNEIAGLNNRMTEIQAAIGRVQLTRLVDRTDRRQAIARRYSDELVGVVVPTIPEGASHVFHQYTILLQGLNRDEFRDALARSGVGSDIYYPVPVHSLPAYDRDEHLPRTIEASASCLSIPVRPNLDDASVDRVIEAVNAAVDLAVRAQ
jgi:dTDP-4-amino-4,6-dideoxygalactose transaminase